MLENWVISLRSNIFHTSAMILGTIIVLFFTLIIIPIQRYADEYSPILLEYFIKKKWPKIVFLLLLTFFAYNIYFIVFPSTQLPILLISAGLLILSFILLGYLTIYIIKSFNPANFLFPDIYNECKKHILNNITNKKVAKKSLHTKIQEIDETIEQVINVHEKVEGSVDKFVVDSKIIADLISKMLPLKTVMVYLMNKGDYETFVRAIDTFRDINCLYFTSRREYRSYNDSLMSSIYDTFDDLLKVGERTNNLLFMRELLRVIKDIAVSTISVNVIGANEGSNNLTRYLCRLLKDTIDRNVVIGKQDAAFEGAKYLGEIAVVLASKGLGYSAAQICSDLADIAVLAIKSGRLIITYPARNAMARIFYAAVYNRKLFINYDYPHDLIIKSYKKVLDLQDHIPISGTHNPLIEYTSDMLSDLSLSSIVRVALFSPKNNDKEVKYNIDVIRNIIEMMERYSKKSEYIAHFFVDQFYQISLWLLAFLDEKISLELLIYQKEIIIPTKENKDKVSHVLFSLIKYLINRLPEEHADAEILNIILSDLYLLLHFNRLHGLNLDVRIEEVIVELIDKLNAVKNSLRYTLCFNLILFCSYLKIIGKEDSAKRLKELVASLQHSNLSIDYLYKLDFVKRPISTFDSNFFAQIDKEIFPKRENDKC